MPAAFRWTCCALAAPQPSSRVSYGANFCKAWPLFDGTASGYWLRSEFLNVFGLDDSQISEENSDATYDAIQAKLDGPGFRPRQLFKDFKIEVLATTDDPLDELSSHAALAADSTFAGRVLPTFRPDAHVKFFASGWAERVQKLISVAGDGRTGYAGATSAP